MEEHFVNSEGLCTDGGNVIMRMTTLTQTSRAKASFRTKVATISTYHVPGAVLRDH